jgi:hypothetical protein
VLTAFAPFHQLYQTLLAVDMKALEYPGLGVAIKTHSTQYTPQASHVSPASSEQPLFIFSCTYALIWQLYEYLFTVAGS